MKAWSLQLPSSQASTKETTTSDPEFVPPYRLLVLDGHDSHVTWQFVMACVNTREVLIHQAIEANRRLEYVKDILGTNDDVAKDAMLKTLLEPLETESEHMDIPESPQITNTFGNATA